MCVHKTSRIFGSGAWARINPNTASSRDYAPGFMTDLMAKDIGLAVNAAREKRVPVVVAPAAQQLFRMASSHGFGRKDSSSVYQFTPHEAGVEEGAV